MKRRLPLYLDCTPMTRQQVCVCCHAVRAMRDDMIYDSQPDHLKRWLDKIMSL